MPLIHLEAHPVVETPFGRWSPLNDALAIRAFGVNAIVCDPGEEFDISHDEADTGQQEAYVVVSGRAAFTIGDQRFEAGPGTVVSAPEPSALRSYTALEPSTRIVCFGAAPAPGQAADYGDWISEDATEA